MWMIQARETPPLYIRDAFDLRQDEELLHRPALVELLVLLALEVTGVSQALADAEGGERGLPCLSVE
jgi:hypothetical protein